MLLAIGIQDPQTEAVLAKEGVGVKTALFFDCLPQLQHLTRLDGTQADRLCHPLSPPLSLHATTMAKPRWASFSVQI